MSMKLYNTLVDSCVVVGVDHNTDLTYGPSSPKGDGPTTGPHGKYGPFKQYVVGVLTDTVAYFPQSYERIKGEPFYLEEDVVCPMADQVEQASSPAKTGIRRSMSYVSSVKRKLPFSSEVVYSLPTFCFPNGGYVYNSVQKPSIHSLVLTNMEGNRTYAVCLTYYKPYYGIIDKLDDGQLKLSGVSPFDDIKPNGYCETVYVPVCICLVSLFPYLNTLKQSLSILLPLLDIGYNGMWRQIMKFTVQITTVPVPPAGPLLINFDVFGTTLTVRPADETLRRAIDVDLNLPLMVFSPEIVVQIINCMLTQQRMIFMASKYPILTILIEAFFTYIEPIRWRLTYVPVLPNSLSDLVEAPGPFIMGVHSSLKSQVKQIRQMDETPSIVLVDIDEGTIDLGGKSVVPSMPNNVARSLVVRLKKLECFPDIAGLSNPTPICYEEMRQQRLDFMEHFNMEIKEAMLDMMVSLFGDMFNFLHMGAKIFDKDMYLQSCQEDERMFFLEVLSSDAFERFVEERLENPARRDAFAVLGEKVASSRKSGARSRSTAVAKPKRVSTHVMPLFQKKSDVYVMPAFLDESLCTGRYFEVHRDCLTQTINGLHGKLVNERASYLYLRGMAHIACGDPIKAIGDFDALYSTDQELFPKDIVSEVIERLDPVTENLFQQADFYKRMCAFRYDNANSDQNKRVVSKKLPNNALEKDNFQQRVKALHIAISQEAIDYLFEVLCQEKGTGLEATSVVSAEQFAALYKIYSSIDKQSSNYDVAGVRIDTKDLILGVSSLVNTTKGMGRLVLTTNMLLFVPDGARGYSIVTRLEDIKEVIKYQHPTLFLSVVQAVRIINEDRNIPPFYACLKDERDLWMAYLKEMSAGHEFSRSLKDAKIVDVACNNVMLVNVLSEMGFPVKDADGVCFYTKKLNTDFEQLSDETKEALQIRLDPCVRDKRTTVMSIVYVPGQPGSYESATVWCGMGSGAIMVYETGSWTCVSELRRASSRISCLRLVGSHHVWAGSFDTFIYVINTATGKAEQRLPNHSDFISDIIYVDSSHAGKNRSLSDSFDARSISLTSSVTSFESSTESYYSDTQGFENRVWSCSCNGQVFCWDPETCEPVKSFVLNDVNALSQVIMTSGDRLWCVSKSCIDVVDVSTDECSVLKKLTLYESVNNPLLLEYALKVNENEIWVGAKMKGGLFIWDTATLSHQKIDLDPRIRMSSMVVASGQVWMGCRDGKVFILSDTSRINCELHAHTDNVKSICVTKENHVITGSASREGKVCVWNAIVPNAREHASSRGYDVIDAKLKLARIEESKDISD